MFPSSSFPSPFSLLKKNRKTAELSFFQGFWKDNGKEEDRLCGLSFLVWKWSLFWERKDLGREEEEASFFTRSDAFFYSILVLCSENQILILGKFGVRNDNIRYSNSSHMRVFFSIFWSFSAYFNLSNLQNTQFPCCFNYF